MKTSISLRYLSTSILGLFASACSHVVSTASQTAPVTAELRAGSHPISAVHPHPETESWRAKVPPGTSGTQTGAVVPTRFVLSNGLTLLTAERSSLPLVHVEMLVKWGSRDDREGHEGETQLTAALMRQGAGTRGAQAFADAIETLGADIDVSTGADATRFSMTVLKENLPTALGLLADTLQRPRLDERELNRTRARHLASLQKIEQRPASLARRVFMQAIYGEHPYGHAPEGTAASLARVTLRDVRNNYGNHVVPALTAAIVVGDLSAHQAHALVSKAFAKWAGASPNKMARTEPKPQPLTHLMVDKPGAPQSFIIVGNLSAQRRSPDRDALGVCNEILGGGFNSRINMNLREDKGWTYGAYSEIDFRAQRGPFTIATGVKTDMTGRALEEIFAEINRIRAANVQDDELREVVSHAILSQPSAFSTVERTAGMLGMLALYELPLDYYTHLAERLGRVDAVEVRRVAMQYFLPDSLSVVVVGDLNKIAGQLNNLNRGTWTRVSGQAPLQAAATTVH